MIDLRDLGLQLYDEPGIPAMHGYARDTTRAWGELVASAAGVVVVTPQYNWGYPAVLKNAIDHLYREWQAGPDRTCGGHGGKQCGEQSRIVMRAIGTRLTEATPECCSHENVSRPMTARSIPRKISLQRHVGCR